MTDPIHDRGPSPTDPGSRPALAALARLRRRGGQSHPTTDPFPRALARTMAAARHDAGQSQAMLGRAIGIDASTICRWESAERTPSLLNLRRLARHLGRPAGRMLDDAERHLANDTARSDDWSRDDREDDDAAAD